MPINNRPLLQGVRVLDLTHVVSGPYATRYLALLGAEIIKIENPKTGGDMARFTGPLVNDCSVRFCSLNHNKRSIRLDLSRPEGRDVFLQLVEKADVVVDNFKPGTMEKLGISFQQLRQITALIHRQFHAGEQDCAGILQFLLRNILRVKFIFTARHCHRHSITLFINKRIRAALDAGPLRDRQARFAQSLPDHVPVYPFPGAGLEHERRPEGRKDL